MIDVTRRAFLATLAAGASILVVNARKPPHGHGGPTTTTTTTTTQIGYYGGYNAGYA